MLFLDIMNDTCRAKRRGNEIESLGEMLGAIRWIEDAESPSQLVAALICIGWKQKTLKSKEWTATKNGLEIVVKF